MLTHVCLLLQTVAGCPSPLSLYRSCLASAPISLEDHEVAQRCEQVLEGLKNCSTRVMADAAIHQRVKAEREVKRENAFLMKGNFDGGV